ncbi:unnamed protein product [Lota lota]
MMLLNQVSPVVIQGLYLSYIVGRWSGSVHWVLGHDVDLGILIPAVWLPGVSQRDGVPKHWLRFVLDQRLPWGGEGTSAGFGLALDQSEAAKSNENPLGPGPKPSPPLRSSSLGCFPWHGTFPLRWKPRVGFPRSVQGVGTI